MHFAVLVVGKNVEEALSPFCESDHIRFNIMDKKEEYETETTKMVELPDGRLVYPWSLEGKGIDPIDVPIKEVYQTYDEYMTKYYACEKEDSMYGRFFNPDGKWDWLEIGGRWVDFFRVKDGADVHTLHGDPAWMMKDYDHKDGRCDIAMKKHIDIEGMRNEYSDIAKSAHEEAMAELDKAGITDFGVHIEDVWPIRSDEEMNKFYSQPVLGVIRKVANKHNLLPSQLHRSILNGTPDKFMEELGNASFRPQSVVMDSIWHDGDDYEDWDKKFMDLWDSIPDDEIVTIVDCHR
ncbi:MAG: hypothetical protein SVK08_00020 [Halobacteriota archaeon]|nr:hypothetical protein [Halobacteriota archaeon]